MNHDGSSPMLSSEDQLALDWLLEHDSPSHTPPPALAPRVRRLRDLLAAAGTSDVRHDDELTRSVLAAIEARSVRVELCEGDQDAVDALVMAGLEPARVPGALRPRAEKLAAIGHALQADGFRHDAALTDRVMSALETESLPIEPDRPVLARIGGRFADIVSVAAVILIAASVVWPVMTTYRENAIRQANQANLAVAGIGFGSYAADYQGALPRVRDRSEQQQWWAVRPDRPTSNAANLFALARLEYTPEQALRSPGNPDAPKEPLPQDAVDWQNLRQVSYSYALSSGGRDTSSGPIVVLADRSPVVLRLLAGESVRVDENSPNHNGRGQHMLRGDGSVFWTTSPTPSTATTSTCPGASSGRSSGSAGS